MTKKPTEQPGISPQTPERSEGDLERARVNVGRDAVADLLEFVEVSGGDELADSEAWDDDPTEADPGFAGLNTTPHDRYPVIADVQGAEDEMVLVAPPIPGLPPDAVPAKVLQSRTAPMVDDLGATPGLLRARHALERAMEDEADPLDAIKATVAQFELEVAGVPADDGAFDEEAFDAAFDQMTQDLPPVPDDKPVRVVRGTPGVSESTLFDDLSLPRQRTWAEDHSDQLAAQAPLARIELARRLPEDLAVMPSAPISDSETSDLRPLQVPNGPATNQEIRPFDESDFALEQPSRLRLKVAAFIDYCRQKLAEWRSRFRG